MLCHWFTYSCQFTTVGTIVHTNVLAIMDSVKIRHRYLLNQTVEAVMTGDAIAILAVTATLIR